MLVIRTAEEMAHALSSSLDPPLKERLEAQRNHLLDYPGYAFEELGVFAIIQPGDCLNDLNEVASYELLYKNRFMIEAESVDRHDNWLELLFILTDHGFGLILSAPNRSDIQPDFLRACQALAPHLDLLSDR